MRDLAGKVAVVTGGASGIGLALAHRLAAEGMHLVVADVEEPALAAAVTELSSHGVEVLAVPTDVSVWESVEALAAASVDRFGAVHVVCNNAGVGAGGLSWEMSLAEWSWIVGVNLWGVIHGIRAFVPLLLAQDEGHVVNTASMAGLIAGPGMAAYCGTKHAVVGVTESLHYELMARGSAVRATVVCPGIIATRLMEADRNWPERLGDRPAATTPAAPAVPGDAGGTGTGGTSGTGGTGNTGGAGADPDRELAWSILRAAVPGGTPPEDVATAVVEAVHEDRFWVLTDPGLARMALDRVTAAVDGSSRLS